MSAPLLAGAPALAGGAPFALDLNPAWALFLGLILVVLNAFFVAAEFALVKIRPTQLEALAEKGDRRAKRAQHMVGHIDAYLSGCQVGITLASLALGWIGEPAFSWILEPLIRLVPGASDTVVHTVSLTAAFVTITVLHIVIGEMAPKSLAIRKPEPTALWIAWPLYVFYKLLFPLIWALNHAANGFLKLFGIQPLSQHELAHSQEEIRRLLAGNSSELSEQKREMLDNIFELADRNARQIMIPRSDVVYLSQEKSLEDNLEVARHSGHTRFPLCETDLDHVIGLVHIKDLFRADHPTESLAEVRRSISFVPETLTAERLLRRMRTERMHMSAVIDEFGGVSGLVTLENVIEEIVGEIQDEFDFEGPELVKLGPQAWQVSGSMLVADLEDELDVELSDRDEDTIAGVVLSELGRRARVGDGVSLGPLGFEVKEIDGNRIRTLRLTVTPPDDVADLSASA